MDEKPVIWIIDTSVFLNILDVPQFNQNREAVLQEFEDRINNEDTFLLPFASILEAGNHIAQLVNSAQRKKYAQVFCEQVNASIDGKAPWKTLRFPDTDDLKEWLADFPNNAQSGKGLGDHIIIRQWEEQCSKFRAFIVKIWSLDSDLSGYECNH